VTRDRAWIAARIPHARTMCLLDRVLDGDAGRIVCAATSHRDPDNPLRAHGRLSAVNAIEYAAQAMALHRAFGETASAAPTRGMLTSVRAVACHVTRLDDIEGELTIEATRISGDDSVVVYAFDVSSGARLLVSGRASAVLDAASIGFAR
jgi:predicted hotdog family 3-hydroxylacyl-ACP dehydratase